MTTVLRTRLALALAVSAVFGLLALHGAVDSTDGSAVVHAAPAPVLDADSPATWKKLATEKDVEDLVELYNAEIAKNVKSSGLFLRGFRNVELMGGLIAVAGNAGVLAFEGEAAGKAAALRDAGLQLAQAAKKKAFPDAKKAAELVAKYPKSLPAAADAKPAAWDDLIDLELIMRGVSKFDTDTNKGVRAEEAAFKKDAKVLAGHATMLAWLAVATRQHNDADDWKKFCDDMCDASMLLSKDFAKKDHTASKASREALQKSCNDCHAVYKQE
ncbi:MAG: hypothetical protein ACRC1K_26435 [Planctomycetia bacterium]